MKERFEGLARAAAARPLLTLGVVAALAVGGALLAFGMQPDAGADTLVSSSSATYRATQADYRHFGGDAVVILIRERLTDLVETRDLVAESELEACLAGQTLVANQSLGSFTPAPASASPYGGWASACGKLRRAKVIQVVYGPGTFLNRAVAAVNEQVQGMIASAGQAVRRYEQAAYQLALARHLGHKQAAQAASAAGQLEYAQQLEQLEQLYLQSGITGAPRIDDPQFIPQIVFDPTRGVGQPKARFAYLFPTSGSALIQARLEPSLNATQQASAISLIRQAANMPMFRLGHGGTYTVTGEPVVISGLASDITGSIAMLVIVALLVMALTLLIVFRNRLRLLPLGIALAAAGITFGAVSLVGGSLTIASIAVLPILIGLAVDYAIQLQSRVQEARDAQPAASRAAGSAIARATSTAAPTIATAALATATGFLVLELSPVPMVRGVGILLVVGIAVALVCALTVVAAAVALSGRRAAGAAAGRASRLGAARGAGAVRAVSASWRGAIEIVRDGAQILTDALARVARPFTRFGARIVGVRGPGEHAHPRPAAARPSGAVARAVLVTAVSRPGRILAVGALLAVLGWFLDTQTAVQSDITRLVPSSMPALHDLSTLERITGVSGELDVTVHAADVATPRTIAWMLHYEDTLLGHYGYLESRGCAHATLCPALSLPDLFCSGSQSANACGSLSSASIAALLAAVPRYFSQAVITPDHHDATLAFGIRLMPLARQERVIDYMRSQLRPPPGVTADLAGLPVLAAQADAALSSAGKRLEMLVAGLLAVGLVLFAVFRDPERALVPLIPIALATGWSALILFLIGIPLNPMSAALGTLVIAISTEFSVLLSERFRQERREGHDLLDALARTYRHTGAAVLASGITAIAGFGVLIVSSITMLRDFGFVTVIDLAVSLAGVLVVLPAVLALSARGALARSLRELWPRVPWLRRRARVA